MVAVIFQFPGGIKGCFDLSLSELAMRRQNFNSLGELKGVLTWPPSCIFLPPSDFNSLGELKGVLTVSSVTLTV